MPSESARRGPRMAASGDGTAVRAAFERLATRSEEPPGDSKFSGVVERVAGRGLDERRRDLWRVAELAPVRLGRTMRTYYGALAGLLAAIGGTAWFVRRFEDFGAESGPSSWFGDEQAPFFHAMFALVYFMPQIVAGARGERRRRGGLGAAYLPIGFDEMTRALRSRAVVQAGLALPGAAACAVCLTLAGDAAGWAAIDGALRPLLLHVLLAPLMVDGVLVCRGSGSLATWSDFLAPRNWIRIGIAVLVLTLAGWFFVAPSPGSTTADRRTLGTYLASVAALAFVAQRAVGRLRREHATEDWR